MQKHLALVAAAAFALGSASFVFAEDKSVTEQTKEAGAAVRDKTAETVGIGSADQASQEQSKHAEAIHDTMAQVAEAALTKDGISDIVERFAQADRDRLNQNKDALKNSDDLNGRITQFQKDWKDKYNQDFDIKDEDKVYNLAFAQVLEGDAARTASAKLGDDKLTSDAAAPAAGTAAGDKAASKDMATVHIAASHGMPALDVPFVKETTGWRIDVPDSVDAQKLNDNIKTALTECADKKAEWASDVDDGYRAVTHRVLLAIFDKPAKEAGAGAGQ